MLKSCWHGLGIGSTTLDLKTQLDAYNPSHPQRPICIQIFMETFDIDALKGSIVDILTYQAKNLTGGR